MSAAQPDPTQAAVFLDCIFRYANPSAYIALRVFPHDRTRPAPLLVDVRAGEGDRLLAEIERGIRYSAGSTDPTVFSPAIATFKRPGTAKGRDIAEGLALVVELDQGDTRVALARLETLLGAATVLVLSGGEWIDAATGQVHAKRHAYWRLSEPTRTEAEHIQLHDARANATMLAGADPTAIAVVHCFRWPGSLNRKRPGRAVLCRIERINPDAEINLADAVERLAEAAAGAGLNGSGKGNGNTNGSGAYRSTREQRGELALITAAMAHIPNGPIPDNPDHEYREWVRWAYAVVGATNGTGFAIFRTWSAKYAAKHDDRETKALWDRVIAAKPTSIGAGSIFAEAKRHGWIDPRQRKAEPKAAGEPESGKGASPPLFEDESGPAGKGDHPPPDWQSSHPPAEEDAAGIDMITEQAVLRAFVAKYRDELRFNHSSNNWLTWTGHYWKPDQRKLAFSWSLNLCRILALGERKKDRREIEKVRFSAAVETGARAMPDVATAQDDWNTNPWLLGTPGGVVDVQNGKLRPGQRSDMITMTTACTPADNEDCPLWLAFLAEATGGDVELVGFL